MRVSIVIDSGIAGGAEGQAVSLTRALAESRTDVELLVLGPGDDYRQEIDDHRIPVVRLDPAENRLRAAVSYFRRRSPDVVHVVKSPGILGRTAAILAGDSVVLGGRRGLARPSLRNRVLDRMLRGKTAGWVVNSEHLREFVGAVVGRERVHVVPNVVFVDEWDSSLSREDARRLFDLPDDRPLLLLIASVRPVKNHPLALRVMRRLAEHPARPLLVFAGFRTNTSEMCAGVFAAGVTDQVKLLGHVGDVAALLRAGDVCLLTSHTEGMPNALLEAGAAGLPAVATDCGGAGEVITEGETGFLVPVDDEVAMAARLEELLASGKRREAMGAAARERISATYGAPRVAEVAREVYERVRR